MSIAERAQSIATPARPSLRFVRSTPQQSAAPESQPSFKVPHLPAKVLRPPRRDSSPGENLLETVSAPPAIEILSDGSSSGPHSPSPVEGEQSDHYVDPGSQPTGPSLNEGSPLASQAVETVAEEPDSTQVTRDGSSAAARPRRGRPRTLLRDAQGNSVRPGTTRKTRAGGKLNTQVVKRRPGRPRLDGRELVTVIQDGVESMVRSRDLKRLSKKPRRVQTPDEESNWEEEEEPEDGYQPRGPTSRFKMPEPPAPISRGPPDQVPEDVMAAYASHAALLQSRTETGLPQLYAAFQTFWIPRRANYFVLMGGTGGGLPYQALTSQGGGPGSSTAVHLSNPSFFYWDPLPLVPGGVRCPAAACSNLLSHAGLVKQPKRVYIEGVSARDPYVGFWIVAARYKCQKCGVRGTANPKVYSSYVAWDQRILENLPPLIRSEFPAVERKRQGRKVFFAAEVALPAQHKMDPQFVSAMIPTQEPQPQAGPTTSAAVSGSNGLSETAHQLDPSGSVAPVNTAPIDQPDHHSLPLPPQAPSPPQLSVQTQPPASGSREEEGEAAERLFAELLFGVTHPHAEESVNAQVQAGAGTSQVVELGNGPDQVLGTTEAEPLDTALPVPESHEAPLPAGSSTAGQSTRPQDANMDLIGGEAPSATEVGGAASSSGHPSGGSSTSGHQFQSHTDIPQPYYPLVGTSSSAPPLEPSPSPQTPSSSPTPPGPSTSTSQMPVLSASAVTHPYFAQFKAPTPQVTAPPPIVFFNPFITPGGSAPASTVAPSVPSWPLSLSSSQPGSSSSTISSYPALTGAIMPSHDANPVQAPGLPIPIIGSYDSQSQVQVQVKKRRGPRKCSKCLQAGCKGANGVQYCPNPCIGCKQVDCKKPHTIRGNLCVESGSRSGTGQLGELVPLEPSPSNSDSANGSGEAGQGDVHMHDAEGELEHELDRPVDVTGSNGLVE
ncbi:hypothetical protein FRC05_006978 [Tulasnella sp. 425]|nr:hypothetical protein FRC05_006978 [Tulasnella sp. 425]